VVSRFDQGLRIVLRSSADPRPGPKVILMRVRASSLNGPGKAWRRACAEPPLLRDIRDPARAAVTAWVALTKTVEWRRRHGLDSGFGGVSVFALQFARVLGARVIVTTATAEKPSGSGRWGPPR